MVLTMMATLLFSGIATPDPGAAQDVPVVPDAPVASTAVREPDPMVVGWLAKTRAAKSYAFVATSESKGNDSAGGGERGGSGERAGGGERSGGSRGGGDRVTRCEGSWQAGSPTRLVQGALTAFRIDDQLVYRKGDGAEFAWERFDEIALGDRMPRSGRGAGGGADAGGAPAAPGAPSGGTPAGGAPVGGGAGGGAMVAGSRAATGMMQMRNVMALAALRAPHELLAKLANGVVDVKRREVDGKVIVDAVATPEFAQELAGVDRLNRMAAQSGRSGVDSPVTATIELRLDAAGMIEGLTVRTTVKSSRRGDQLRTLTYELSAFEQVSYEVPKGALDLLAT
ncbi:MAG: hypothetical protein EXS13_01300 [Planctomycetes bacterium]|nr:hypothetical protein [Planctomycetota bacterium]